MEKFFIELSVRNYELDVQGIVNNSVYQNYLEHARHQFLHHHGVDFVEFAQNNILLVVKNIEINFKNSLVSRDAFKVEVSAEKEGNLKVIFHQNIIRLSDNKLIVSAKVTGVAVKNGRPVAPDSIPQIAQLFTTTMTE
ncbi:acyl-CoA thioesterase [Flavobacterium oreochromis]|uniref:4-hydroxybenzoyl-CoA thioesterase n=2 Tax=Flavobacterium TaxID=237 RepID=A0A2D0AHJ8_9FLAO|nr:acyl-CoA thioesterase [Flavobacterium oreochromis]OWP75432.1 4-hydroxybenzoyl-CoA thioesterase [Flavobacterium oreochromis]OWP75611.1 4-hydroxybenzoyl-CoA thioesterase [Flavobacterium oreochromis]POR23910.1 4-hydroxybenzoyl-CoA thioesterase [Flavobacterium columnare]QYS85823.1 acyl-CoA thioesterase [Flavobacterium oreochromis]